MPATAERDHLFALRQDERISQVIHNLKLAGQHQRAVFPASYRQGFAHD
jgi:hypothetical protein